MKSRIAYLPLWILIVGIVSACSSSYNISNENVAQIYKQTDQQVRPDFQVYHLNDEETELNFRIQSKKLLYAKKGDKGSYTSKLRFNYVMYESFNSNLIADSGTFHVTDTNNAKVLKEINGQIKLKAKYPNKYVLKITAQDLNKNSSETTLLVVDKTSRQGRQNYLLENPEKREVKYTYTCVKGEQIKITYNSVYARKLYVKYYDRDFPLSPPPFASYSPKRFDFTPDSLYEVNLDIENSFVLDVNKNGLYHIQTDTSTREGLTLLCFDDYFPQVRTPEEMVGVLRFITTNREYERIQMADDTRKQVEEFWQTISSSNDRARELIRSYYGRVEESNRYFTSHIQGWKSDRGLIYIVFGPPDVIYKSANGESWIYGNGKSQPTLTFNFSLTFNPFSANDFRLNRSPEYKNFWYKSVDTWRQGRVYSY
ncbi:GWxTD domain-containing protein [bacterium SCSIO 12741]|nr:GWxTD domain-containing protein [bacterium SCSIO 12741]